MHVKCDDSGKQDDDPENDLTLLFPFPQSKRKSGRCPRWTNDNVDEVDIQYLPLYNCASWNLLFYDRYPHLHNHKTIMFINVNACCLGCLNNLDQTASKTEEKLLRFGQ